jgi:prophage maintenance system killer protein
MSFEKLDASLIIRLYNRFLENRERTLPQDTTTLKAVLESTLTVAWRESVVKGGDLEDLAAQYVFQVMRKGCFGEDTLPMGVALIAVTFGLNGSRLDAREVTLQQELLDVQTYKNHAADLAKWLRENRVLISGKEPEDMALAG